MKNFFRRLYKLFKPEFETRIFLGHSIRTSRGTIRKKTDYDDAWFFYLAKERQVIFDIGSNVGYTALISTILGREKQILLVDANMSALAQAAENLIINDLVGNARFYRGFVSDKEGDDMKFYTVKNGAAGSMHKDHAKSAGKANEFTLVRTTTIDKLMEHYKLIPDFVKIDVEGAESYVLDGSITLASYATAIFLVEMHSSNELSMRENAQRVISWCNKNKYKAWYLKEKVMLEDEAQIAHRGKCHLLLQPIGRDLPFEVSQIVQGAPLPITIE
jgi:FkbM family methyltransferase